MQIRTSHSYHVPGVSNRRISQDRLISLYTDPPSEEITLDEFELFALDRLQLLRGIEALRARGYEGADYTKKMDQLENKYMPLRAHEVAVAGEVGTSASSVSASDCRRDSISHFILRLAYCKTEDLRRWFLTQECHLLKHR
jgi:DNA primase large subunit